jgi:hypothetical protein
VLCGERIAGDDEAQARTDGECGKKDERGCKLLHGNSILAASYRLSAMSFLLR